MKGIFYSLLILMLTSCYTTKLLLEKELKGNNTINLKQTHLINGLFSFDIPEMKKIIDKENYTIITNTLFIDLALNSFTFGIYSPTTIIIKH